MSRSRYYYIFLEDKYVDTKTGVKELAEFLQRPVSSVEASLSKSLKRNKDHYTLKDYKGNKYYIQNEIQFFGKKNVK